MRKIILLSIAVIFSFTAFSQDFSNRGKDFWVGYGYHQVMTGGNSQDMVLYFATDTALLTNITVDIPGIGFSQTFPNIPANTVFTTPVMPKGTPDARILAEGLSDKGIHVTSDRDIVAYAHIYNSSVSGSCVLLPTNTLGKEYYSINYDNVSNSNNAYSWMYVIAADTGTTTVEITPSVTTQGGWAAGSVNTVTLTQGQVYNIFGVWNGGGGGTFTGEELTGTKVRSIASGSGICKRIAVFSGSGRISIRCPNTGGSSDNYMVQSFPKAAWGKNFLTASTAGNMTNNIYRVCVSDPAAVVTINGVVTTLPLQRNFYYEIPITNIPQKIESDLPITVAQYTTSQGTCGNGSPGDPEVIYLSPVEQSINDVLFNSNLLVAASPSHFVNVIIPNAGTALTSFTLDGATPPVGTFTVHPQDSRFSYARFSGLTQTSHRLKSDSGFNAIAYGFANAESYGYNAGTNVRDLNTQLEVNNPNTSPSETTPSACTGSPFQLKVFFPNQDNQIPANDIRYDSMKWEVLNNVTNFTPNNFPVMVYGTGVPPQVLPDSITIRNGRQVAWYSIPGFYTVTAPGVYRMRITVYRTNSEGCGNSLEYEFNLTVTDPPTASFTAPAPGCYLEPVVATETTPQIPKTTYKFWWEFYDPLTNVTTVYAGTGNAFRNATHTFTTPGPKRIRHASITTPGCISDTIMQTVILPDIPTATLSGSTTVCINAANPPLAVNFFDGRAPWQFIYSINGVNQPPITTSSNPYIINAATGVANTFTYRLEEVRNSGSTVCVSTPINQTHTVIVQPDHDINLAGGNPNPTVCVNTAITPFTLTLAGGATNIAAPVGLPAGVTATVVGTTVTVSGTPTLAGTYPYTITTTGNGCLTDNFTGTITVNPDHTIALTSANANQTVCINTPITPITLTLGGGATGITSATLPPGVTATVAGTTVTISGTPTSTVGSPFNYSITTTGNSCVTANFTGTITVEPDHDITLAGGNANQTVCVNNAITPFTLTLAGGATNIAAPVGLPAGVTATVVGTTVTVSGTPTLAGTYPYTITTTGNACITDNFTGTITVSPDHTIALTSANANQTVCINTPITPITLTLGGGATGITSATLPPGVTATVAGTTVTISGTPTSTVGSPFNYSITTTGNSCVTANFTGTITVEPDHDITLAGGNANPTVCVNNTITPFTLTLAGGANNIAAPVGLPAGVTATVVGTTVTVSGTPTLAGTYPYTITTTGNACITDNFTGTITVTGDATVTLNAGSNNNQTVCRNTAITDIDYTIGGTATGLNISWVPAAPTGINFAALGGNQFRISGTPSVVGTQTYTYTLSSTGPCVVPNVTGTITVNALPVASYTYTIPSCANNSITFTNTTNPNAGGVTTWAWDFGDPGSGGANTSNLFSPTHTFALPGNYTVTLNAVNSNGCISNPDAIQNIIINDTPRAGFIVPEVCINDVATVFTDTSSINAPSTVNRPLNEWNYGDPPSGPLNNSIGVNGVHLYPAPGVYTVRQIVTSNTGCRDTIYQDITINSADPVSNFDFINRNTLCSNDSVQLRNLSTVGFGNVTRLEIYWDVTGAPGVFETVNVPVFNGITKHKYLTNLQTTTTYNIRVVAYSGNICFATRNDAITVHANPVVQFNNMPPTCLLVPPFQITQGSEIGGVPGTQSYSGPGIINAATGLFDPQVAGVGTHPIKYTFTASNPGACFDTLTKFITVIDTAHASYSYVSPTCENTPVSFTDLSTAPTGVVLANTVWNFGHGGPTGTGTFAPGATFTHVFPGVGNYTVTMHNISAAGCLSTDTSAVISILPNHTIGGGGNNTQTVCINRPIVPIVYNLGGGATNATITGLPAGLTYNVVGTTLTIQGSPTTTVGSPFNFTINTTGNACAIATTTGSITVQPDHTIVLATGNTNQSVCVNTAIEDITYTIGGGATGVTVTGLPPGVTFAQSGNTITISGTPSTTTGSPFNFTINTTGNTCVVANIAGSIKVNPYPVPFFAPDKSVYCIPVATVKFNNNSTMPDGTGMTYAWEFDDPASGTLNNSTAISPTHFFATQRTYDVKLTATSLAVLNNGVIGCSKDITIPLTTIKAQPKAAFSTNKPAICIADDVVFTDETDPTIGATTVTRYWDFTGSGTFISTPNPTITHLYPTVGTYAPTMYIVNSFGCHSDTLPKPFIVHPYPVVNAGKDRTILEFGSAKLEPTVTGDDVEYLWTPNIYFNNNNRIKQPTASLVKDDITYKLTVTSRGGCTASDDVFIKVLKFPKIPNTFTPNNDGINDKWVIEYLNSYPNCRVQVFNRTGQLVFESKGYGTPWDGTMKGKPLPFDTYYYVIEPQAGRDPVTGYVTIVK